MDQTVTDTEFTNRKHVKHYNKNIQHNQTKRTLKKVKMTTISQKSHTKLKDKDTLIS